MSSVPLPLTTPDDCWNRIGIHGDRTCPELAAVVHCHHCPVFAAAGRRFLDAPAPPDYAAEWARRLAVPAGGEPADLLGALLFRLGDEWLALEVGLVVEVTATRPAHRIPQRGGAIAGLVNIRGELHLCAHLDAVLGVRGEAPAARPRPEAPPRPGRAARLLVIRCGGEGWAFAVDEVDGVHRLPRHEMADAPATLSRSLARLVRGVFGHGGRSVGLLDGDRLFQTLRSRTA